MVELNIEPKNLTRWLLHFSFYLLFFYSIKLQHSMVLKNEKPLKIELHFYRKFYF
jgi:hypothetical protein